MVSFLYNVNKIGKMSALKNDVTFLQINLFDSCDFKFDFI